VARRLPLPPFVEERPWVVRILLIGVVPAAFGFLCGAILDTSGGLFLGLQVLAAIGGYLAGFEHAFRHHAALRAIVGGLIYGGAILVGHHVAGGDDHDLLPDPELFQLVITAVFGLLLGILGWHTRLRIEARAGSEPSA
jgi:hypothetical protein